MPLFGLNDLRCFFGTGVPVSFNGIGTYPDGAPVKGLFDRPVEVNLAEGGYGGVEVAMPELRLPVNAFDIMPSSKDTITVDGTDYRVASATAEDDGAVLCYRLKAARQ